MPQHPKSKAVFGASAAMVIAVGLVTVPRVSAQSQPPRQTALPLVNAVDGVEMVVSDLGRSRPFFESIGFVFERQDEMSGPLETQRTGLPGARSLRVQLRLGAEHLALVQYLVPTGGALVPRDSRGNDLWFQHVAIVVSDMDRAFSWLRAQRVAYVSSAPQTLPSWNHVAAGIRAFYFADPDGHTLELIQFPKGKGDPRWQTGAPCRRSPAELCSFLGIDHTAITVSDTDRSLAFYRDQLGLRLAGQSENYGPEQEHLNGVFGARLRITSLRAARGPGIELLQYLSPRDGRPMPAEARPNDLFHWQIVVNVKDVAAITRAAVLGGGRTVSQTGRDALVRDRDGHALFAYESEGTDGNSTHAGSAL